MAHRLSRLVISALLTAGIGLASSANASPGHPIDLRKIKGADVKFASFWGWPYPYGYDVNRCWRNVPVRTESGWQRRRVWICRDWESR
jgi:hypothetical protein